MLLLQILRILQLRLAHILRHEITEAHRWRYFRNIALGSPQGGQSDGRWLIAGWQTVGTHKFWWLSVEWTCWTWNCGVFFQKSGCSICVEKNPKKHIHVWVHPDPEPRLRQVLRASQRIWSNRSRWRTLLVALAKGQHWSENTWVGWEMLRKRFAKSDVWKNAFNPSPMGFLSQSNSATQESWGFRRWEIIRETRDLPMFPHPDAMHWRISNFVSDQHYESTLFNQHCPISMLCFYYQRI